MLSFQIQAQAASFGRLTVYSGLGEPLRAEIQIVSPPEKKYALLVELASREDYKNAGVEYSPELRFLQLSLGENESGQTLVRLTSSRPLTLAMQSFLLELRWTSGRQLREFTINLEPGGKAEWRASQTISTAIAVPEVQRNLPEVGGVADSTSLRAEAATRTRPPAKKQPKISALPPATTDGHQVKAGETLYRIAVENKSPDVPVEQMLVALYRRNPDSFFANNINRLRVGAILEMPDQAMLAEAKQLDVKNISLSRSQARALYRHALARGALPSNQGMDERNAGGIISARVEESIPAEERNQDQVKVSASRKTESNSEDSEVDVIARQKAQQEASERNAELERNIEMLQKLLATKEADIAAAREAENLSKLPAVSTVYAVAEKPAAELRDKSTVLYLWLGLLTLCMTAGFVLISLQLTRQAQYAKAPDTRRTAV